MLEVALSAQLHEDRLVLQCQPRHKTDSPMVNALGSFRIEKSSGLILEGTRAVMGTPVTPKTEHRMLTLPSVYADQ